MTKSAQQKRPSVDEGEGRRSAFWGCNSFSYRARVADGEVVVNRQSLAMVLYRAGRLVEIAKTDRKFLEVLIEDKWGGVVALISTSDFGPE